MMDERELADLLRGVTEMPRSEMRERALTAVQGVRRRRTRMTAAWVVGALVGVPLLLGAAVATGVLPLPWPVKGNLYLPIPAMRLPVLSDNLTLK